MIVLLRKPLFWSIFFSILFVSIYFSILKAHEKKAAVTSVTKFIDKWQTEFGDHINEGKDPRIIAKIASTLEKYPVSAYQIYAENKLVAGWPEDSSKILDNCDEIISDSLSISGMMSGVGIIKVCLSDKSILKSAALSPILILMVILGIAIIMAAAFLPMQNYKKSFKKLIGLLREHIKNPNSPISTQGLDNLTEDVTSLVTSLIQSKLAIKEQLILTEADSELKRINRNIAHDLKHPLNRLEDLENSCLNKDIDAADLQFVKAELHKINEQFKKILGHLLQESDKSNRYKIRPKLSTANITSTINEVATIFKGMYPDVDIQVNLPERINFRCNEIIFQRVITNIFKNSIEAMDKLDKKLIINFDANEDFNKIMIEDNGKGIPDDKASLVFDPDYSFGKGKDSNGLGLSIVRSTICELGGNVTLTSKVGKGTTIKLSLPKSEVSNAI